MKDIIQHSIGNQVKFSQLVLLDKEGYIQQSCKSLFDIAPLNKKPIQAWVPFIESIFDSLLLLKEDSSAVRFAKIEKPASFLPGYYDFTFTKVKMQDTEGILWCIYDYTDLYKQLLAYQQRHNELEIYRQLYELGNQQIKHSAEIPSRKNFFEHYIKYNNHSNQFYTKINHLLSIHENPFDLFSLLKDKSLNASTVNVQNTIKIFSEIQEDYYQLLQFEIEKNSIPSLLQLESLCNHVKNITEQKLKHKIDVSFNYAPIIDSQIVAHKELIIQVLFNLFIIFYEQSPQTKMTVDFSILKNEAHFSTLNIAITEFSLEQQQNTIKQPTSLLVRLALIKKVLQRYNSSIATENTNNVPLKIFANIPCQTIE